MSRALRTLLSAALLTDREASCQQGLWHTRCLHCRARLIATEAGDPLGATSLEHIVPRSWFARVKAAPLTTGLDGPNDPRNLALACARCNQQKGRGPDAAGPGDAHAFAIVERLQQKRLARYREVHP